LGLPEYFIVAARRKTWAAFFFAISSLFLYFARIYQAVGYKLGYKISMPPKVYWEAFLFVITAFLIPKFWRNINSNLADMAQGLKFSQNKLECLSERPKPTCLGATGSLFKNPERCEGRNNLGKVVDRTHLHTTIDSLT